MKNNKESKELALHYMKTLVEVARESFLILDSNLRVVSANPTFYQNFQVTPEQTEKVLLYELGDGQWNIPELRRLMEEILPEKKVVKDYEVKHIFESIGEKTILLNARQIDIDTVKMIVLAMEDISVRKELEEKLAITAKELAVTAEGKENVRKKLEVTAEELKDKAEVLATIAREKENTKLNLEVTAEGLAATAVRKEDVRKNLAVTAEELAITAEELAATAEGKEDVRKKLEVTDEAILTSVGDGVVVVDAQSKILFVNHAFEELLGWKQDEVIGKPITEVIPSEDETGNQIPFKERILSQVLAGKKVITTTTNNNNINITTMPVFYFVRKNKTRFLVNIMATPVIIDNKIIGAVEVFRDITQENAVDKAKTEFVSLASHQLRTPLSAINWYTEMLIAGDAGKINKKQREYLDQIYAGNQRMVKLVNAFLNVSRLELGTFAVEPERVDLNGFAGGIVKDLGPMSSAKKIIIKETYGDNLKSYMADPKLLRIIIENFLTNAIKYTPEKGKVSIELTKDKKCLYITVSDTGYGIPKDQRDQIFTKLFRADNVRVLSTEGTGLGLYIVKSIVEHAEGKIWFESKKGGGTTFYVTLPASGMKKKEGLKTLD